MIGHRLWLMVSSLKLQSHPDRDLTLPPLGARVAGHSALAHGLAFGTHKCHGGRSAWAAAATTSRLRPSISDDVAWVCCQYGETSRAVLAPTRSASCWPGAVRLIPRDADTTPFPPTRPCQMHGQPARRAESVRGLREQGCETARAMSALVQDVIESGAAGRP